jgi:hypothetical protein
MSRRGKALAGDDPYLVRNAGSRELVIVTPTQLKEFVSDDLKGAVASTWRHWQSLVLGTAN